LGQVFCPLLAKASDSRPRRILISSQQKPASLQKVMHASAPSTAESQTRRSGEDHGGGNGAYRPHSAWGGACSRDPCLNRRGSTSGPSRAWRCRCRRGGTYGDASELPITPKTHSIPSVHQEKQCLRVRRSEGFPWRDMKCSTPQGPSSFFPSSPYSTPPSLLSQFLASRVRIKRPGSRHRVPLPD